MFEGLSNGGHQIRSQEAPSAREAQSDRDGLLKSTLGYELQRLAYRFVHFERLQHRDTFPLAQPVSNYLFEASVLRREGNLTLTSKVG